MRKLSEYITRKKSVVNGGSNFEKLYSFSNFPVYFGCTDQPENDDIAAEMTWYIDRDTGLIQLNKLIPLDLLYPEQHVDGVGPSWENYYQELSDFVVNSQVGNIMEIGGGSGKLAELILEKNPSVKYTMLEPNPAFKDSRIRVIKTFFDEDTKLDNLKFDTIIFSQVLEHSYDPDKFLKNISNSLKGSGKLLFGYPNLESMIKANQTNTINFEHTMLLTDYFVDYLLSKNKIKIIKKQRQGSVNYLYLCQKDSSQELLPLTNKHSKYKRIFKKFIKYHNDLVANLNKRISESDKQIYLFGAHIFSQFLIQFGLNTNKIVSIIDNGMSKQNRRLYGTSLISRNPSILRGKGEVVVILKAGSYNNEIKSDILENINDQVIFWE